MSARVTGRPAAPCAAGRAARQEAGQRRVGGEQRGVRRRASRAGRRRSARSGSPRRQLGAGRSAAARVAAGAAQRGGVPGAARAAAPASAAAGARHRRSAAAWPAGRRARGCRSVSTSVTAAAGAAAAPARRHGGRGRSTSMLYGLVSGSAIRSCSVAPPRCLVLGVQRVAVERQPRQQAGARPAPARRARQHRPAPRGRGGVQPARPGEADPPRLRAGRNSASSAGSTVSVQAKAISMPTPAISPSCATPAKAVGVKARNPAAVASAATRIWPPGAPARPARRQRVGAGQPTSRKRTVNWMAKSTAMPTNSTAKATETRFSVPTASAANAGRQQQAEQQRQQRSARSAASERTASEQPERDQQQAAEQAGDRPLGHGGELLVVQRHRAGDAHARAARRGTNSSWRRRRGSPASPRRRAAARRNRDGLGQHEAVRPGQVAPAARPAASATTAAPVPASAAARAGGSCVSAGVNGRQVGLAALDALGDQRQRGDRPRRLGSAASWPRNGWASIVWSSSARSG